MPKPFNLYVDDLRAGPRNSWLGAEDGWEDWVIVRSVNHAKTLLSEGLVMDLSLDHDMGYGPDGEENPNGKRLVFWMIKTGTWPHGSITIHSGNITAALEMKELLDKHKPKEQT